MIALRVIPQPFVNLLINAFLTPDIFDDRREFRRHSQPEFFGLGFWIPQSRHAELMAERPIPRNGLSFRKVVPFYRYGAGLAYGNVDGKWRLVRMKKTGKSAAFG